MPDSSIVSRAVGNLLRLADSDLKDAELLSSGRNPGNAPGLLQRAIDRLVQAVLATEQGWPLSSPAAGLSLLPDANPLKTRLAGLTSVGRPSAVPVVLDDGSPPALPDKKDLRAGILAVRGGLKDLASAFEVDLFGTGPAGRAAPVRPAPSPQPRSELPQTIRSLPARRPEPATREAAAARPRDVAKVVAPRATPLPKLNRVVFPPPHEVAGRASLEMKRGPSSTASTAFWALMDRWDIPDTAALDLIGHPGGLTKKGTRPRFKLVGEEADLLRSLQEIDAALVPLQLEPRVWLKQPIEVAPFNGDTPVAYLTRARMKGVHDTLRFILQHGLQVSMSASPMRR